MAQSFVEPCFANFFVAERKRQEFILSGHAVEDLLQAKLADGSTVYSFKAWITPDTGKHPNHR